ncbi:MAG: phosphomannomutase/phosphoglucomutase [Clostridiales bacterium]|nr:phosphomannomutase/phosphoglucomutase [Candidatus Crickella caballi]
MSIAKLQNGSDIRGIALEGVAGEEVNLTEIRAGAIASSYVEWLAHKVNKNPFELKICIGHDPRLSADPLMRGLKKGICIMGSRVWDAGLASTPGMFMANVMPFFDFDGSIMVTASHLPWNRNGLKFFTAQGGLEKEDIELILKKAAKIAFVGEWYESENANVMEMYAAQLRQMISSGLADMGGNLNGMHIVVDAGNGSGGFFVKQVLEPLGADCSGSQFLEPDGNFPNHQPNPEDPEAMASVCKAVTDNNADLGIIFDTDVDRSAAVGPDGKPIARNEIVALAAALGADDYPGGTVVTDSITSNELHDFLENKLGLRHYRYKRGYRNVINKAMELSEAGEKAFLAIETSGHAAFSDNYYLDDGAFLAVQIIVAAARLKKEGKTINSLMEGLGAPLEAREIRIKITAEDFAGLGTEILEGMSEWVAKTDGLELEEPNYEGVRVNYEIEGAKGWFLLRKSLHDPVMPLNIESDTEGGVEKTYKLIKAFLSEYEGIVLP